MIAAISLSNSSMIAQAQSIAPKRIGIIGSGRMGGTVGRIWVEAGHDVMFSSRHPDELRSMVEGLPRKASTGYPKDAAEFGAILFFATPYLALEQLGSDLSNEIQGKVVLDATNPRRGATDQITRQAEAEGFGIISARMLPGARLVRAFSAVDSGAIDASFRNSREPLGVPIAGDDRDALDEAANLVRSARCEPVIVGDLRRSRSFDRSGPGWLRNTSAAELRVLLNLRGN